MATRKTGPITADELMALWRSVTDRNYHEPLIEAGDGHGLEVYGQAAAQFARISKAVDRTTQAMYVLPHSGQTDASAAGGRKATVTLSVARSKLPGEALFIPAGALMVEEIQTDFSTTGPVQVETGRRFITTSDLYIAPGESGPVAVTAEAESEGYSYNNPMPGTITGIVVSGTGLVHDRASVSFNPTAAAATLASPARAFVATVNEADTFVPDNVGCFVAFTAGANTARLGRIKTFMGGPDVAANIGSTIEIDLLFSFDATTFAGSFQVGERITTPSGVGVIVGFYVNAGLLKMTYRLLTGSVLAVGDAITGQTSGATATVRMLYAETSLPVVETGAAAWRVLDWVADWGLTVTNAASPVDGVLGTLDLIGDERDMPRASGEPDPNYAERISQLADVVSPNAIQRSLSRALGSIQYVYREIGASGIPGVGDLPGFYIDHDAFDTHAWIFTGAVLTGTFAADEALVVESTSTWATYALGWFGKYDGGTTRLWFIPRPGARPYAGTNVRVRGLTSGATLTVTDVTLPQYDEPLKPIVDYTDMRAFFEVEVPKLGLGEFGFAYDAGTDPYDVGGAFDGFPYESASIYARAYQAGEQPRAGGVSWRLVQKPDVLTKVIL